MDKQDDQGRTKSHDPVTSKDKSPWLFMVVGSLYAIRPNKAHVDGWPVILAK